MAVMRRALHLLAQTAAVVASSSYGSILVDARGGEIDVVTKDSNPERICDDPEDTCLFLKDSNTEVKECGIWLAPSTLPGAGSGLFAGRDFEMLEALMSGDIVIPIVDILMHQKGRSKFPFLWDEYTWNGRSLGLSHEVIKECNAASPGFGAAANSFLDLVNIEEGDPENSVPSGLHRSKDPGVGAFTTYHNRVSTAKSKIKAGQELFANYGQHWFEQRPKLGPIPLRQGLQKSTTFYRKFKMLRERHPNVPPVVFDEIWDEFVKDTAWNESRIIGAFHHTQTERYYLDKNYTLKQIRSKESTRPLKWLQENGRCADHLREDVSTIRQAGRGAFATRDLPQGAVVAPLPLIHIKDKGLLEMYALKDIKTKTRTQRERVGYQLLLNYCFGHLNTTLLLCPYGTVSSLVNHNQTRANVKLEWADPRRSNHDPDLLQHGVKKFASDKRSRLAMDLIATRPILKGEEVLLDYGDAWEKAWQLHVENWNPDGANEYVSALMHNQENTTFRTEYEQIDNPYPGNVNIQCDANFWKRVNQTLFNATLVVNVTKPTRQEYYWNCDVLRHREVNGTTLYTVIVTRPEDDKKAKEAEKKGNPLVKHMKFTDLPSAAIRFTDRPYTTDMFLREAFRHPIMIPDDLFPKKWINYSPIQRMI